VNAWTPVEVILTSKKGGGPQLLREGKVVLIAVSGKKKGDALEE